MEEFYSAWWYLYDHHLFENEYGESKFLQCLDIYVAKVNPETNEIDDECEKNTKIEIWLECGGWDKNMSTHDIKLDCGGNTYEEVIIELAKLVKKYYN